jgi:hypothetical protein
VPSKIPPPRFHTPPSYRDTSLPRTRTPLEPYRRPVPRVLWEVGGGALMDEVPL